jgi:hypothetical protein
VTRPMPSSKHTTAGHPLHLLGDLVA